MSRRGYTLSELLLVTFLLATVASLVIPVVVKCRRRARETACAANLGHLWQMAWIYRVKACIPAP
jgi:prepilin-type N-terminal cleavage/methylation domain-containing protein